MNNITLPREVVERALEALFMYKPMVTGVTFQHGLDAMQALREALEQSNRQSAHESELMMNDAGCRRKFEQPQGEQEPVRKMYVCNSCQFPYADQPPSQCDCLGDETYTEAYLCTNLKPKQPPTTEQSSAVDQLKPAYLLRDLADELNVGAIELMAAIRDAGFGNFSVNMELPAAICVAMCFRFGDVQPQVEQEPVAATLAFYEDQREPRLLSWNRLPNGEHRLYTHSQPKQPLTDEDIRKLIVPGDYLTAAGLTAFARSVERKIRGEE